MNILNNLLDMIRMAPGSVKQPPAFQIPDPTTAPPPVAPVTPPANTIQSIPGFSLPGGPSGSFTGQDWLILAVVVIVVGVGFFFVRGGIQGGLIRGARAEPPAARAAGWAWWMFAVTAAGVIAAGFVGEQWSNILFAAIGGGAALVLLLVAVFMTISAASKR
jgi:hypothetical protein